MPIRVKVIRLLNLFILIYSLLKRNARNLQSIVHSVLRKVCLGTEPYSFVYICQSVHFATLFFLPGVLSLTSVHIHNGPKLFFTTFFIFFRTRGILHFIAVVFQKVVSFVNYFIKEFEQKFYMTVLLCRRICKFFDSNLDLF